MTAIAETALEFLAPEVWQELRAAHERRIEPWIAPRLVRGRRGEKHPVDDFLFEYYGYRPGLLRRWHPGFGRSVERDAWSDGLELSSTVIG